MAGYIIGSKRTKRKIMKMTLAHIRPWRVSHAHLTTTTSLLNQCQLVMHPPHKWVRIIRARLLVWKSFLKLRILHLLQLLGQKTTYSKRLTIMAHLLSYNRLILRHPLLIERWALHSLSPLIRALLIRWKINLHELLFLRSQVKTKTIWLSPKVSLKLHSQVNKTKLIPNLRLNSKLYRLPLHKQLWISFHQVSYRSNRAQLFLL